ncbi:PDR/VanB family oxidoreductase [Paractinoplanes globisporus]|uniref:PDR/VanB family oxidoreductase n=1 Tax=Paractinoplanes globisporus TaxID=113565 RepID=A0ABW6WAK7_9ACTN|nr:PDR/VanB family oxidoreductase [Actinoplanes globisporus]
MTEFEADLVVRSVEPAADGVVALTLAREDGRDLPEWTPGAHIDLILGEGLVRQYSLCGRTGDRARWRIAVLAVPEGRGGSVRVHSLAAGETVRVRGPRNHFPVVASRRYLFLAGGIGITPLLPMIREVAAAGADWELYYGGRSRASMAFTRELAGDRVHLVPEDSHGRLDLDAILGVPRPGTLVYACGPEGMLAAVEQRCATWPPGSLHLERFTPRAVTGDPGHSFEVVLAHSGRTLPVHPERSIFETIRAAGVSVLGSCLEGICGTCETEVIDGEIDHRDSVLDDEERASNEVMMICVSRCKGSRLTLAL